MSYPEIKNRIQLVSPYHLEAQDTNLLGLETVVRIHVGTPFSGVVVFNSYSHFTGEFTAIHLLNETDKKIYEAREAQYRSRYPWSGELEVVWSNCLVHTSANVPGKIAYFATVENMRANKLTRTSPEMFLQRYLVNAPEDIKLAWEAEALGKILPTVLFVENDSPSDWYDVYCKGPGSCMKGSDLVEHYAHPKNNLALAYMVDDNGNISARTVVNKKTKAYARIYGNNSAVMFAASLRKLGYHHNGNDTLLGEIIYVEHRSCTCCDDTILVGPYLDCDYLSVYGGFECNDKPEGIIGEGSTVIYGTDDDGDYRCESCS